MTTLEEVERLADLSKGWERRDVSSEEYVAALRAEVKRLEGLILDWYDNEHGNFFGVSTPLIDEARRIRAAKGE